MIAILWVLLLAAGARAELYLVQAGTSVAYQHLLPPGRMVHEHPIALVVLAIQIALVLLAAARQAPAAMRWISERIRPTTLALVIAALAVIAAAPSRQPAAWLVEAAIETILQIIALANVAIAVSALPADARAGIARALDRLLGQRSDEVVPAAPDRLAWTLAAFVTLTAIALNILSYQRQPHVPDEIAYLLQARGFAHGMLAMPAPPVPAAFDLDLVELDARGWYSIFPPGWPAVLAIGVRLGAAWIINPILGGITILLASALLRELYAPRTARLALILLALSPWQLFLAMSFMSHTLSLALTLVAGLAVAIMRRTGTSGWGWIGGIAIGTVSVMRPLEGVAVAGFLGLVALSARGMRIRLAPAITLTLGAMVAGVVGLWYNRALTGSPTSFPVMTYFDKHYGVGINALGFGANRGLPWRGLDPFPGHGPIDVAINSLLNTFAINVELFGWALGSLLPVLCLFAMRRRVSRVDYVMLAGIAAIVVAHAFYWFSGGPDFGARYWFLIIVPLAALAARGITQLEHGREAPPDPRPVAAAIVLCVVALTTFVPWRAADKYFHYRGVQPGAATLATARGFGRSLVLVRGRRFPDFAGAAVDNPLDLTAEAPIFAWDRDSTVRAQLLDAYAGRPVWMVDGPTVTGEGYSVFAGPLTADQAQRLPVWAQ